jgi:hypothetical protein
MNPMQKALTVVAFGVAIVVTEAYTGYVKSYLDEETQTTFFMKHHPTLQMEFYDPFANEGDDVPINQWPLGDRLKFADYCQYRFGISGKNLQSLETCKGNIPPYLR